jgi:hypothetical protein
LYLPNQNREIAETNAGFGHSSCLMIGDELDFLQPENAPQMHWVKETDKVPATNKTGTEFPPLNLSVEIGLLDNKSLPLQS